MSEGDQDGEQKCLCATGMVRYPLLSRVDDQLLPTLRAKVLATAYCRKILFIAALPDMTNSVLLYDLVV